MAKIYEAMLLSQGTAPEATKQFLTDYNFTEVLADPLPFDEGQDLLDLEELGLTANESHMISDHVETNVAVAEAIAESVATLATSFAEKPMPLSMMPPVELACLPPTQELIPMLYRAEFRQLSENLLRSATERTLKTIVVCGVDLSECAAFVLENLSLALAENSDLRVARFCLLSPLTSVVPAQSGSNFQIKIHRTAIPNLCEVVPLNGPLPMGQLLRECDIEKMMEMLKTRFDFVLIETDAVNWTDEVATFAGKADGVILVAQKENMRGPAMSNARQKLQQSGAQVLGAVLNHKHEQEQFQRVA